MKIFIPVLLALIAFEIIKINWVRIKKFVVDKFRQFKRWNKKRKNGNKVAHRIKFE